MEVHGSAEDIAKGERLRCLLFGAESAERAGDTERARCLWMQLQCFLYAESLNDVTTALHTRRLRRLCQDRLHALSTHPKAVEQRCVANQVGASIYFRRVTSLLHPLIGYAIPSAAKHGVASCSSRLQRLSLRHGAELCRNQLLEDARKAAGCPEHVSLQLAKV